MIDLPPECQAALQEPVMQQIYQVESSGNPFAIGVVGGRLVRQPKSLDVAVATVEYLTNLGRNFSIGQGQVNKSHFVRLGWDQDIQAGFDVCKNVVAAHDIFKGCYSWALSSGFDEKQTYSATDAALSCYYSGKLTAGKSNPDVTRYINEVKSQSSEQAPTPTPTKALAIPLAKPSKGSDVHLKASKQHKASMLLSGNSSIKTTSSMMLIHKEKD